MKDDTKSDSLTKKGVNGLFWTFSGSLVQILSQFLVVGILARLLTPEEFGIVAIVLILVRFTGLFAQMGIGSALIQLPSITNQHRSVAFSLSVILGLFLGGLFYLLGPFVGAFFDITDQNAAFEFFAIFFPLNSFSSISLSLLTRELRFSLIVRSNIISYIFGYGLASIVLAYYGMGVWALILGQFFGTVIYTALMIIYCRPSFSLNFDKKIVSDLLFFGTGHTLSTVLVYFAENSDNIVVGKSSGVVAMGIYSKAFQLFSIPASFFGQIFNKVLFPILSQKQGEKEILSQFYLFMNSLCFGILFPVSIILFVNAKLIVTILLGDQWLEVVPIFQILIFGLAYRFGARINKSYLKSMGIVFKEAYYQLIYVVLMFGFCYLGALFFDLIGVAVGVLLAALINYVQMSIRIFKELQFEKKIFFEIHLKTLLLYLPFLGLTLLLFSFGIYSIWVHLALTLGLYAPLTFILLFRKWNVIFKENNTKMIKQVLQSLPSNFQKRIAKISVLNKYV